MAVSTTNYQTLDLAQILNKVYDRDYNALRVLIETSTSTSSTTTTSTTTSTTTTTTVT